MTLAKAKEPFCFFTRLHLSEVTGLKAQTLAQLLELLKTVPGACIYHHTHRFLQQHQYLSPEPPNDFAFWVADALGDDNLAERLASIDTIQFSTIRGLRDKIIQTIQDYLEENPAAKGRFASEAQAFYFIRSVSFVLPTEHVATDLREFVDILGKITFDSIYYHIFEARLRLEKGDNDFSNWIRSSLDDDNLAKAFSRMDPYTLTMDDLRRRLVRLASVRIGGGL